MSSGVLSFSDYLAGPDNIVAEAIFPSTKRTYAYNFDQDISGWTWAIDYQTLIIDPIAYDRNGQPNFANSKVIGYFPKQEVTVDSSVLTIVDAAKGLVNITIPANRYTGAIIPDARKNVPVTIVGITWTTADTTTQTNSHRWAFLESWEPNVTIGNPVDENDYTAFTVA
jgi:hypothetical protein